VAPGELPKPRQAAPDAFASPLHVTPIASSIGEADGRSPDVVIGRITHLFMRKGTRLLLSWPASKH